MIPIEGIRGSMDHTGIVTQGTSLTKHSLKQGSLSLSLYVSLDTHYYATFIQRACQIELLQFLNLTALSFLKGVELGKLGISDLFTILL